jgi:hypothetical protein
MPLLLPAFLRVLFSAAEALKLLLALLAFA